ncbi:MAG: macro domain-containing protein [Proteobacteria bacterium]|nr:macro domain-containing protein [Pseudomonadota bacterium]
METLKSIVIEDTEVSIIRGDLTESNVDAIVNAANSHLQHGGGVAGAIVRKGGSIIQEESNKIGYVPVGNCAITSAGKLKAKYVIHAVGPRWGEGDEENKLKNAVKNILNLATEKGFKTISMPAISAGIFGFPKESCAQIMIDETGRFLKDNRETSLKEINFYLIDKDIIGFFKSKLETKGHET